MHIKRFYMSKKPAPTANKAFFYIFKTHILYELCPLEA